MIRIAPEVWREDLEEFREKTREFYAGELDKNAYKGFSGGFGSYAQRGGKASMLRLRMPGGRISKDKLEENGFERLPSWQDALERYLKEITF